MSKMKDLLIEIQVLLSSNKEYKDVVAYVQSLVGCDNDTAHQWVDASLCMNLEDES